MKLLFLFDLKSNAWLKWKLFYDMFFYEMFLCEIKFSEIAAELSGKISLYNYF